MRCRALVLCVLSTAVLLGLTAPAFGASKNVKLLDTLGEAKNATAINFLGYGDAGAVMLVTGRFGLKSYSLRDRAHPELLDESSVTKEAPIFERARATTRVADVVVQRFSSFIDNAVQESSFGEAQQLQLLRMRLIRDYSGLWLLVNRPSQN